MRNVWEKVSGENCEEKIDSETRLIPQSQRRGACREKVPGRKRDSMA